MKKIILSAIAVLAMNSFATAGGNVATIVAPVIVEEEELSGFYAGLAVVYNRTYSLESEWFDRTSTQDETGGFTGIAGYNFNEYVAVEGRFSTSFFDEDYADVMTYSIFVKPQYPVTEEFKVYALLGFGGVQIEGTDGNEPGHANMVGQEILDETSFQWGFGTSYAVTENFLIFADYTSLADDADISSTLYSYDNTIYDKLSNDAVTVGVVYNF